MARYILDIANIENEETSDDVMKKILDVLHDKVARIDCIDITNENQFHDEWQHNILTEKQIKNFYKKNH